MEKISEKEFILRQPSFPKTSETDGFYLSLANRISVETSSQALSLILPEGINHRIALTLTDYLQDIVADAGLWRSFIEANRQLYGWSVPFHSVGEEYIDYELNKEDVRFLVWYIVAMLSEECRDIYPHSSELLSLADACFEILEDVYEEAPVNSDFNISKGLEFNVPEDVEPIYHLGNWLFLHSYLLTPAFAVTMQEILQQYDEKDDEAPAKLNKLLEEAMLQNTTGPLALFTPEWVYLMIEGKLRHEEASGKDDIHPYYEKFVAATGGEEIAFFSTYEEMNNFFITALGWEKGVEHLAQVKGASDYALMVNKNKGMLMARGINRCIAAPRNPSYDKDYAAKHSFELLTVRGLCPGDLLRFIFKNKWLPDARFPGSDDVQLVDDNHDFIARCYLQIYYRGD